MIESALNGGQISAAELHEEQPNFRLETDLIFLRHGKADQLPGADTEDSIDYQRIHTKEGEQQVLEGGKKAAKELGLGNGKFIIIKRSSPRTRAAQTVDIGLKGFVEELKSEGLDESGLLVQESVIPAYNDNPAKSRQSREYLNAANPTQTYAAAKKRVGKDPAALGAGRSISESWTRDPQQLQQDLEASGFGDLSGKEMIGHMHDRFQNSVAVADRASGLLAKKWRARNPDEAGAKPPRLVILEGSHGFVSEPWLKEVLGEYEKTIGHQVTLELEYGDFWRVHWPSNPKERPTLHINNLIIPITAEHLAKLKEKVNE